MKRIAEFFQDDNGKFSMNRLVGFLLSIALAYTLYQNSQTDEHIAPSSILVETVGFVIGGTLGFATAKSVFKKDAPEA